MIKDCCNCKHLDLRLYEYPCRICDLIDQWVSNDADAPCPWCGKAPVTKNYYNGTSAMTCGTDQCPGACVIVSKEKWNERAQ